MLILPDIWLLIIVRITHYTIAIESGIVGHYDQIIQIHEET